VNSTNPNPPLTLGIDAGGTSLKLALANPDGTVHALLRLDPLPGHILDSHARPAVLAALQRACVQLSSFPRAQAIYAGFTGLASTDAALEIRDLLAKIFTLPTSSVQAVHDIELAYRAHFAPDEGILVYAGTGAIAFHLRSDGSSERAGGHGCLIDDAGSGFGIGQAALRAVLRGLDEGRSGLLTDLVFAHAQCHTWPELSTFVYNRGRSGVAGFAPLVGQAAHQGDEGAQAILEQAGHELLRLATVMRSRLGPLPVVLAGGALQISPVLAQVVQSQLEVRLSDNNFALAAARLALGVLPD
jgi:glucosamine kinase